MKDFLKKLIARKKAEMAELQARSDASEDLTEVREIGKTLAALKKEIEEAEAELAKADDGNGEGDGSGEGTGADEGGERRSYAAGETGSGRQAGCA